MKKNRRDFIKKTSGACSTFLYTGVNSASAKLLNENVSAIKSNRIKFNGRFLKGQIHPSWYWVVRSMPM